MTLIQDGNCPGLLNMFTLWITKEITIETFGIPKVLLTHYNMPFGIPNVCTMKQKSSLLEYRKYYNTYLALKPN